MHSGYNGCGPAGDFHPSFLELILNLLLHKNKFLVQEEYLYHKLYNVCNIELKSGFRAFLVPTQFLFA